VLLFALGAQAQNENQWSNVAPGVDYRRFESPGIDVHVTRVDLTSDEIRVIATRESERGMRVSEFGKRNRALVAVNADYFDAKMQPIGMAIGPCGWWDGTNDNAREGIVAIGDDRAMIHRPKEVMQSPEPWIEAAVSGWPLVVDDCKPLASAELPGSDAFTRSPHPRTAVGFSKDRTTMYFVVADGRREGVPGMTLAELGAFMSDELDVCSALNLDGGGSSAMWVGDKVVNRPSDGSERRVVDHIGVVMRDDFVACDLAIETKAAEKRLAIKEEIKKADEAKKAEEARKAAESDNSASAPSKSSASPQ
jgi:exopolysaccharide biosynthesis protein